MCWHASQLVQFYKEFRTRWACLCVRALLTWAARRYLCARFLFLPPAFWTFTGGVPPRGVWFVAPSCESMSMFEYACSCVRNVIRLLGSNLYVSLEGKRVCVCVSISLSCDLRPHVAPIRTNQKAIIRAWRWVWGQHGVGGAYQGGQGGPVYVLFTPTCAKISFFSLCQPEVEILADCFRCLTSGSLSWTEIGSSCLEPVKMTRSFQIGSTFRNGIIVFFNPNRAVSASQHLFSLRAAWMWGVCAVGGCRSDRG